MSEAIAEILALDAARADALVRIDIAFLDRITSEDYTHVESSGHTRTKAEFLDGLREGAFRFETFAIDENHVRLFGDTAIVTGRYHNDIRTPAGLQPTKYARHIRVYVRRGGAWRNVAHQATEAPRDWSS
ncbi:nuclear transport factor 2 family protein [Flavisphingomonas formosensis]|uniref:nuclear transport factor 2 family protein n=1 Tax=Flavisphingomonas formosensis TaxID=861534 RepID=UPI0012F9BD11|nr:nuclear transport factor 2 family protein [Sphingomonas formosensis]